MSIITLTTDLGYRDPYLAIVKAKLLASGLPLQVIDLSCDLRDNNISDAAFILKNSLPYFPDNTIHLVAVKFISDRSGLHKPGNADNSRFLVTRYRNQFIISPDNGLFTLIDQSFDNPVYQLYYEGLNKHHFFLRDVFVDAAVALAEGKQIADIAVPAGDYYKSFQFESYVNGNMMRGKGIYVDDFGNIITNITREKFEEVVGKKKFTITLPGTRITHVHTTYDEVKHGAAVVLFNSFGLLEVAVNGKSALKMLCPRDLGTHFDFNLLIEIHD